MLHSKTADHYGSIGVMVKMFKILLGFQSTGTVGAEETGSVLETNSSEDVYAGALTIAQHRPPQASLGVTSSRYPTKVQVCYHPFFSVN